MGIKNLLKFLSEQPDIIKKINIKEYYGKKIAIDISIILYQIVIAIRNSGADLTNSKGEITSHILGLFNKTINFLDKGIIPIYEPGLEEMLTRNMKKGRLSFTTNISEAIKDSEVLFISVGTPPDDDGSADLKYVLAVARDCGKNINDYLSLNNENIINENNDYISDDEN